MQIYISAILFKLFLFLSVPVYAKHLNLNYYTWTVYNVYVVSLQQSLVLGEGLGLLIYKPQDHTILSAFQAVVNVVITDGIII